MDDPEGVVGAWRDRSFEVVSVETTRYGDDLSVCQLGERRPHPSYGLAGGQHDAGGRAEQASHSRQFAATVDPGGVDHHLVECPGIAEVGYPGLAERTAQLRPRFGGGVRGHERVDHVDI